MGLVELAQERGGEHVEVDGPHIASVLPEPDSDSHDGLRRGFRLPIERCQGERNEGDTALGGHGLLSCEISSRDHVGGNRGGSSGRIAPNMDNLGAGRIRHGDLVVAPPFEKEGERFLQEGASPARRCCLEVADSIEVDEEFEIGHRGVEEGGDGALSHLNGVRLGVANHRVAVLAGAAIDEDRNP